MDSSVCVDTEIKIDDQAGEILKEFPDIDETSLGEDVCLPQMRYMDIMHVLQKKHTRFIFTRLGKIKKNML